MGSTVEVDESSHQTTLTRRIYMSATEVTNERYVSAVQWAYDHSTWDCNNGSPYQALGYRLPMEAEWEFACRAGTTTHFNTGNCLDAGTEANYYGELPYTDCPTGPYIGGTSDVASYLANHWELFDMHGNVYEWCNDLYGAYKGDETDPIGAASGIRRVMRGGDWYDVAGSCRSANRDIGFPWTSYDSGGIRVVRSVP